uniref:Uncharacterized protein n=1 Tax=Lutzomyia longipalpis TaxID=7200 RepID=A0A1B0GLF2_LUTLO
MGGTERAPHTNTHSTAIEAEHKLSVLEESTWFSVWLCHHKTARLAIAVRCETGLVVCSHPDREQVRLYEETNPSSL